MALTVESIVRAALDLVNAEGLDSVSTRRLAAVLGVKGPALYRHFPSMQVLLGEMSATMLSEGLQAMTPTDDWANWLEQFGHCYRQSLLRYRDGARMLSSSAPTERMRREIVPGIYAPLLRAGFTQREAFHAEGLIAAFVLGWVIHEQNDSMRTIIEVDAGDTTSAVFDDHMASLILSLRVRFARDGVDAAALSRERQSPAYSA